MFKNTIEMTDIRANEDLHSPELDFLDTCIASMSLCLLVMILGLLIASMTWVLELESGLEGDFHTIQQDQVVHPSPSPPVQSAPQVGAFVLHGKTEATPYSVVAHAQCCLLSSACQILRDTWGSGAPEFLRRYSFNTIVDVSRRGLEALRQRPDESVTSFISHISWVFLILILTHLVQAIYGIEDGIAKGLWAESSASNSKGKKPGSDSKPSDVGTIGMMSHRSSRRP
ncbi:hypothetical protein CK203_107381 [Vitis vinifera]|uniref:Uncharacterized protein n=1 Tax=Vitis vinifera TaxID=29760 RepID=A0A438ECI3_VITVI|nr:hypothetical protein CK203_107381 [Vitis vinifera]